MNNNQPDWESIAGKFDVWLPQIAPVGEALLDTLDAQAGDRILDVASGTGEPALTLARRMGREADIIGVDSAEGMVKVAQRKVEAEGLANIHFKCMPAEKLRFENGSFDKVLCRFGVMLFEDPLKGMQEIRRVLKPRGHFAIAVWSRPETMRTLYWSWQAFKDRVPTEAHPPLAKVTSLGEPGILEELLGKAGFTDFHIEVRTFHYQFPSFEQYWDAVEASDILKMQYEVLAEEDRSTIRDEIALFAKDYQGPNGLFVPHEYLLAFNKYESGETV